MSNGEADILKNMAERLEKSKGADGCQRCEPLVTMQLGIAESLTHGNERMCSIEQKLDNLPRKLADNHKKLCRIENKEGKIVFDGFSAAEIVFIIVAVMFAYRVFVQESWREHRARSNADMTQVQHKQEARQ